MDGKMIDRIEQEFPESYRNGDILMIHGDCLEKMKYIPDKSIDMILCDLPYGTTACKWDVVIPFNKYVQIGKKVIYEQEYVFDKMKSGVSYKEALEDFLSVSKDGLWDNYKRIIKDRGAIVLFGSEPFSSALRMSNIKQFKYDWIWDKQKPTGMLNASHQPLRRHEIITVFCYCKSHYYPQKKLNPKGTEKRSLYKYVRKNEGGETVGVINRGGVSTGYEADKLLPVSILQFSKDNKPAHPTHKPVALLENLIKTYTLEGETVLDNCMGSGSTGIACINTNRNFIGIEKDDKYFGIAKKRIEEAQNANA